MDVLEAAVDLEAATPSRVVQRLQIRIGYVASHALAYWPLRCEHPDGPDKRGACDAD
jgi:hypothetical protein